MLSYVKRNGPVTFDAVVDELGVPHDTVDAWASSLEDADLIEVRYSARKGRILEPKAVAQEDEKLEEVRKETEERLGRLAELSSGEENLEQFQTLLERLKRRLREREDETLALEDVFDDEHREALDRYRENLIESEIEVEELERELDDVIAGMNMLSMMAEETGYDVSETEEKGFFARLKGLLPGRGGSSEEFTCTDCGTSFDSQHGVKVHRGLVHSD